MSPTQTTVPIRIALILLGLVVGASSPGFAQSLSLQGGNLTLSVTNGAIGSGLTPVLDASTKIRYKEANVTTKITVQTICPGQKFTLAVIATSVGDGTAAPSVNLVNGMLPTDLITNIGTGSNKNQTSNVQYTASATFAQGNSNELGNDNHTVIYTLVAQ